MNQNNQQLKNTIRNIMASDRFIIAMNFIRIGTLIGIAILIFVMVGEIEAVKLLGSDVCKICMEKTGCFCSCIN